MIWILLILALLICGCQQPAKQLTTQETTQPKKVTLTIFHAGSLTIPLHDLNEEFEKYMKTKGYDVEIRTEASGSVMAVRKVTDLGRKADIVAVADYTILPAFMYPKYADFYIAFARNELVLCYTDKSKYSDEINGSNWYKILGKEGVKFGFSNPNVDPCGYRSVMAMKLADLYYNDSIFHELIEKHTNIRANGTKIISPRDVRTDGKVVIRDKSVNLIALLESGSIDYAFEYKSVALQHNLKFVELPDEINLKNLSLKDWYGRVSITVWKVENGELVQEEIKARPIMYGLTIPKNAENREIAEEYLAYLLSDKGRGVFAKNYQEFLEKPLGFGNVPDRVKRYVEIVT
ncbi:tungstate ABC transporter substrate-binding protein WtpA [Archaeoglobus profundus]|uniref:Extracellular solute-binding protein family 1 n=1 Tax=Archaeoglobus profundus (strain DSM 5631 / JCM 9629 / NBRC 100127 / Av18) TaxID=572546 RepID=D2RFG4_ARCPA|nr:tungstate ABC transporter substrate-binding protein WtpA [Archaeoglobus profundus]ADB58858.1 extracellular solute-binding protein family 1 [Archaeoglobus profundus DSM 5631]